MVRQCLTKASNTHGPYPWLTKRIFVLTANLQLWYFAAPSLAAGAALITKSTQVISLISKQVAELWYIHPIRAATKIVFVLVACYYTACTYAQVMVHHIMAKLSAAAA